MSAEILGFTQQPFKLWAESFVLGSDQSSQSANSLVNRTDCRRHPMAVLQPRLLTPSDTQVLVAWTSSGFHWFQVRCLLIITYKLRATRNELREFSSSVAYFWLDWRRTQSIHKQKFTKHIMGKTESYHLCSKHFFCIMKYFCWIVIFKKRFQPPNHANQQEDTHNCQSTKAQCSGQWPISGPWLTKG